MVGAIDTVIFVDVDGVLNVGVGDKGGAPILVNQPNLDYVNAMRGRRCVSQADQDCIDRLCAVSDRELGHGEVGTYANFSCNKNSHVAEVLTERLARIVKQAGPNRSVVLSSSWRKAHHAARVKKLEAEVARHLGGSFAFDGKTRMKDEKNAADRLRVIGDYVETLSSNRGCHGKPLRLLVLEDFFITPLNGWDCDGTCVHSAADAEAYLCGRAQDAASVSAKFVHTYDEWVTSSGLKVQVGTGLALEHCHQAEDFLSAGAEEASTKKAPPSLKSGPTGVVADLSTSCGLLFPLRTAGVVEAAHTASLCSPAIAV